MRSQIKKPFIAANWKMNGKPSKALTLAIELTTGLSIEAIELVICAPFTHLDRLAPIKQTGVCIGAQNCHFAENGAYTGEVSASMLADLGCEYIIIGHSERRSLDSPESILPRIRQVLNAGMSVIYCCGEPLAQKESGQEWPYVSNQLQVDLESLSIDDLKKLVIAYEPIWAIGTGLTASPNQTQNMHLRIRNWAENKWNTQHAQQLRIIYGGSVKASNAADLSQMDDIDGFLVGGASLIPNEFRAIIQCYS